MHVDGFDWDLGNLAKIERHGLTRLEIEKFFTGHLYVMPDLGHSASEERFIAMGRGHLGHPTFVAFAIREVGASRFIRPISARLMHKREVMKYESAFAKDED